MSIVTEKNFIKKGWKNIFKADKFHVIDLSINFQTPVFNLITISFSAASCKKCFFKIVHFSKCYRISESGFFSFISIVGVRFEPLLRQG